MNKKGFTLVEILVVIVLLSIIIMIAVPAIANLRNNTIEREAQSQIEEIESAAGFYARDITPTPESVKVKELINTEYIKPNVANGEKDCENAKGCLYDPYGNNLNERSVTITQSNGKITTEMLGG